jgi:hypothetical protein
MKSKIISLIAIAKPTRRVIAFFLISMIIFTPFDSAIAATVQSNSADTAKQAGERVVKEKGVKQRFGKTEKGADLIDRARDKANQKLNDLAVEEADPNQDLPESKKLFLDNLKGKS